MQLTNRPVDASCKTEVIRIDDESASHGASLTSSRRGSGALVEDLQAELDDARLECAADDAAGACSAAVRPANGAWQIQVGVVQDVVELGPEFNLQALDGGGELFIEREIGLVEGWVAKGVARGVAEGTSRCSGQGEGGGVDVLNEAAGSDLGVQLLGHTLNDVWTEEVRATEAVCDGRRNVVGGGRGVGQVERGTRLHGVDSRDLPASESGVDEAVCA